jgi:hypothetical protein
MARTWSNRKITKHISPVERERRGPNSKSVFLVALVLMAVFFLGVMGTLTVKAFMHPPVEVNRTGADSDSAASDDNKGVAGDKSEAAVNSTVSDNNKKVAGDRSEAK